MSDENDSLESRILKKVYTWLVLGGVTIGGVGGSGILRTGKFTHDDFQVEKKIIVQAEDRREARMREYIQRELEHQRILITSKMPPEKTRARFRALERHVEKVHPEYNNTINGWN